MHSDGTLIPPAQWVHLQYRLKNPRTKAAAQFHEQISVKMMIQQKQFCHSHVDAHYCAALLHYLKEYALKLCDHSLVALKLNGLVCLLLLWKGGRLWLH